MSMYFMLPAAAQEFAQHAYHCVVPRVSEAATQEENGGAQEFAKHADQCVIPRRSEAAPADATGAASD